MVRSLTTTGSEHIGFSGRRITPHPPTSIVELVAPKSLSSVLRSIVGPTLYVYGLLHGEPDRSACFELLIPTMRHRRGDVIKVIGAPLCVNLYTRTGMSQEDRAETMLLRTSLAHDLRPLRFERGVPGQTNGTMSGGQDEERRACGALAEYHAVLAVNDALGTRAPPTAVFDH
jgi:hypothetical protein